MLIPALAVGSALFCGQFLSRQFEEILLIVPCQWSVFCEH